MNKYVLALTATALTASVVAPVANANELAFKDLSGYAKDTTDAVQLLVDKKIVNGTTATTFSPNAEITRGQVVKILGRYLQNVEGQKVPADWNTKARFSDVPLNHSDKELVQLAALTYDAGIFTGSEGKLMTSGTMSRENLALVMNRLAKQMTGEQDLVALAAGKTPNVADLAKAKEESRKAIQALNALNISNVADFNPKGTVKRVHFASLFAKLLLTVEELEKPATPEEPTKPEEPVVDEAVTAFEEAMKEVKLEALTIEKIEALLAQFNSLTAEQQGKLNVAVTTLIKNVEEKLEELKAEEKPEEPTTPVEPTEPETPTQPTEPEQPTTPVKTEAEVLAEKIASIGPSVSSTDINVRGAGNGVVVQVLNPSAGLGSFVGLYGSIVGQLGIVQVNGLATDSFAAIGYFSALIGEASTLGDLKGRSFSIPVTVNNTGTEYSTSISITVN